MNSPRTTGIPYMDKKIVKAAKKAVKAKTKKVVNRKIRKLLSDRVPLLKPLSGISDMLGLGRFKEERKEGILGAPVSYSHLTKWQTSPARREQRSELLGTVNGSVAFVANYWVINPAIPLTFPWLSTIAQGYQQYRFNSLRFRYETTSPTSSKGQVVLVPEYGVNDIPPENELTACNAQGAVSNTCWSNFACNFDIAAMHSTGSRKFIRSGNNGVGRALCDSGVFYFATVGMADASAIGRVWVDYDITLYVPQAPDAYVRTADKQSLRSATIGVIDDSGYHQMTFNGITQNLYLQAPVVASAQINLLRGIYRISGTLRVRAEKGGGGATLLVRPKLNGNSVFAPNGLIAEQFSVTLNDLSIDRYSEGAIPINFVVQADQTAVLTFEYNRFGSNPAHAIEITDMGSVITIEPA